MQPVLNREETGGVVDIATILILQDTKERPLAEYTCSSRNLAFGKDAEPFGAGESDLVHCVVCFVSIFAK